MQFSVQFLISFHYGLVYAGMIRDPEAHFRNDHRPGHVHQIMLFRSLRGNKYSNGKQAGKPPVPPRDLFSSPYADKAEPAYQTVNGRKQIRGSVNVPQPPHGI